MGRIVNFGRRPNRGKGRWQLQPFHISVALAIGVGAVIGYLAFPAGQTGDVQSVSFTMCDRSPHYNCVMDGDTFYMGNQSIRIADIDTPETHPPRCDYEATLGAQATRRLLELLNAGLFVLEGSGNRDEDQYGRKLRIVVRSGYSLGDVLVSEGLARDWTGRRLSWCG